jgi:two-component system, chemotaxis family, sensor kinase Cph1
MPPSSKNPQPSAASDEFLLRVIHDLRGPLRKAHTRAQLLQEQGSSLSEENRAHLKSILDAHRSSEALLARLSEYCFCGTERDVAPIQVRIVISGALSRLVRQREGCVVDVRLAEFADLPVPQRLEKVFYELLDNSLKFHKGRATIVVGAAVSDRECAFTVEDDGIGFDVKFSDLILRPLERLHSPAEYAGAGMGLAICDRVLQTLGGSLSFESSVDRGTKATFTLPRVTFPPTAPEITSR